MAVLGAAGGIGQPLALLMKMSPFIGELSLYDVANTPGVASDLSHMSTGAKVTYTPAYTQCLRCLLCVCAARPLSWPAALWLSSLRGPSISIHQSINHGVRCSWAGLWVKPAS